MLSIEMADGYTFFLGHLISFLVLTAYLYWFSREIALKHKDKVLHAGLSMAAVIAGLTFCKFVEWPWYIAPILVLIAGFVKELADLANKKKRLFDWMDIVADLMGNGSITLLYLFSFVLS